MVKYHILQNNIKKMKDSETDSVPVSESDYRRAFERVRMTNKKLTR